MAPDVVKKDRNFQYNYQYNYQHYTILNRTTKHQNIKSKELKDRWTDGLGQQVTIYFFSLFTLYRFVILVNASNE